MSASYDPLPLSSTISSGSSVPRRSSGSYPHSYDRPIASSSNPRSNSPADSRRSSYSGYDSYRTSTHDVYRPTDHHTYGDYRRPPNVGMYDRYRDPHDNSWDQSKPSYSSRDYYVPRHTSSPASPSASLNRDRNRRESVSMMASRMIELNNNWRQSNGHDEPTFYASAPTGYDSNGTQRRDSRDQDSFSGKVPWSSHSQSSFQNRHYRPVSPPRDPRPSDSRDRYSSYKPAYNGDTRDRGRDRDLKPDNYRSDRYSPYASSHHDGPSRNSRRSLSRGRSRSPRQFRSRTRSRSRFTSRSRSRSWSSPSRSSTRSVSRSSSKRSRLPQRNTGNDRSTTYSAPTVSPSWSRDRSERDQGNYSTSRYVPRSPQKGKQEIEFRRSVDSPEHVVSRSPSRSSIASSRETSVKPTPSHQSNDTSKPESSPISGDLSADKLPSATPSGPTPKSTEDVLKQLDSTLVSPAVLETEYSGTQQSNDANQKPVGEKLPPSDDSGTITAASESNKSPLSTSNPVLRDATPSKEPERQPASIQLSSVEKEDPPVDDASPKPTSSRPIAIHAPTVPDLRPEDIPKISDAKDLRDALRVVVMTRLLAERQTRQQLVEPVLMSNHALPAGPFPESIPGTSPDVLMDEMTSPDSECAHTRREKFDKVKGDLVEKFEARQVSLKSQIQRLTEEYTYLHEKWLVHCAALDEETKVKTNALLPPVGSVPSAPPPPITGRTTRRSAASLGDAVRSDFEMEQIIASLGYDEAMDPNQLCCRNIAKIPEMISVINGKVDYVYDDNNLLVEDPVEYYAPQTGINDWTEEEKQTFLDKFAAHPKQFGAIAKHLPNKTTAQCVDYYYLQKKVTIDFRKVVAMYAPGRKGRRGRTGKRKGNALLTDIIQHDAELSSTPNDPTVIAAPRARGKRGVGGGVTPIAESRRPGRRPGSTLYLESTPTTATPTPEPEAKPRRRRAIVNYNRSSLGAQGDLDDDLDDTDDARPAKRAKRTRKVKSAAIVDDDDGMDSSSTPPPASVTDVDPSDSIQRNPSSTSDNWSDEDKELFLKLLGQHGDDFKKIAASMSNKTTAQVSGYYKANKSELDLEKVVAGAPQRFTSPSESTSHKLDGSSSLVSAINNSASTSADRTPPMASLVPDDPSAASESVQPSSSAYTNGQTHPSTTVSSVADLYVAYADAHRYPRYTTSVTSPYGAMPMSTMYAPSMMGTPYTGITPAAGYRPSTNTPPHPGVPNAISGYAANAAYGGAGSHYVPYTYPYQQGAGYPPSAYPPHVRLGTPPVSSGSPVPPSNGVNTYAHSIPDPNAMPRPYYRYS